MARVYASGRMWTSTSDPYTCPESEANASYIWSYFKGKGWSNVAIAGLVGNCTYESYTNPGFHEVGGAGFGIVQWTPSSNYINWARPRGFPVDTDYSDPERYLLGQCERINYELQTGIEFFGNSSYGANYLWCNTWQKYITLTESDVTPETAAHIFLSNYERPNHSAAAASLSARQTYARRWYDKFKSGAGSSSYQQRIACVAADWAVGIANNEIEFLGHKDHGYDQGQRWGERGDFDCSSLVIQSYIQAGMSIDKSQCNYTGNMYAYFTLTLGFQDVTSQVDRITGSGLMKGDVLLNHVHHTALALGDGTLVQASINEHGSVLYGTPGDQTGTEIWVAPYYNYPWNYVLRHSGMTSAFGAYGSGMNVSIVRAVPVTKADWTKNPERNG